MENELNNQSTEVPTTPVVEVTTTPVQVPVQNQVVEVPTTPVVVPPTVPAQEPSTEVKKEKKKITKKTIIRLSAVLVVILAVAAYFIFFYEWKPKLDPKDPESVTEVYYNYLIDRDYSNALKYVYLPNYSYVDEDDFFSFVSNNSKLSMLYSKKIKEIKRISKVGNQATYEVIMNDDEIFNTNLNMLSDGYWYVVVDNLYITDWKVEVPGNSKLYIDNKEVNKTLSKLNDDTHSVYTIPAIAPSKKEFKIETSFDTYTTSFDVAGSNNGQKIIPELNKEEEINNALKYIKETWNSIYKDYTNSVSKEEVLKKYYDSKFTVEDMDTYYSKSFDSLTRKGNKQYINTNVVLDSIIINPNKKSYIEANDVIRIEFGYKMTHTVDFVYSNAKDWEEYMTRYSSIELKKTNDEYKIYRITDDKLFNYLKYNIKEYK